jgi:transcriptional regulator with XRE-family HTH domain
MTLNFPDRLRKLRKELKISQGNLSEMIGVSERSVPFYERGLRKPSFDTIIALCKVLNVSSDYLLGLKEND